jgi:hypothetical protein
MHLIEHIDKLSSNDIERIERLTLRWIFQAAYDFGSEAHEIFRRSRDDVEDVAEDVTRELLDRLPGHNIPRRIFGTVDYKKYRYIILPELLVRQTLFVDSKAEKSANNATLQMSQTSLHVRQKRGDREIDESGLLPSIYNDEGVNLLTTTAFIHFNYKTTQEAYRLLSATLICLPNGLLQEKYNPDVEHGFWRVGRNAPTRGEDFRVRVSFQALANLAPWRVQKLEYDAIGRCAGQWHE